MIPLPDKFDPATVALFLDVDGTLLEICDDPGEVRSDAGLNALLETLFNELDGALSLVSGRSIAQLDRIFAPASFPAAGSHGAEIRLRPYADVVASLAALPNAIVSTLSEFAQANDGLLLERKNGGVSLHYRKAPALEADCRRLVMELMPKIEEEFRLIPGKMVYELAPLHHDKGIAIKTMMQRRPFSGRRPLFIGDDITDEDGFRFVNQVDGISVRVGEESGSEAVHALGTVSEVRQWLEGLAECLAD